jgi:hypothetical protein
MPLQKPARQRAKILGGSTFALLAPLLAAPCGPFAMCFLRPARGFGWLDPNTISKASKSLPNTTSPKNRTNHKACPHTLHAERVAMTDEFRPKIWTIVQIFGLLLLQRIPAI